DVERNLDLRQSTGCRWNAGELELADRLVVRGKLALALKNVDLHRRLIVVSRREGFALLRGDRRVTRNEHGGYAAQSLDSKREWGYVEQQYVLLLAREDRALNCCADSNDFIGIYALVGLFPEEFLDDLLDLRNARRATDENHFVDLVRLETRILERLLHGRNRPLNQVVHQLLELR